MKTILIPYSDNYRINIVAASFIGFCFLVASTKQTYFTFGFLFSIVILARSSGLEIDIENKRYRDYKKFFARMSGKWKPLDAYTDIVIQSKSGAKSVLGMRLTAEIKIKMIIHSVWLMDENHMKKIFLKSFPSYEEAKKFAEDMAIQSNFVLASFKPVSARNYIKGRRQ